MRIIFTIIFSFLLAYSSVFANDNSSVNKIESDNSSTKKLFNNIPPKLVPDRYINDKNLFMGDFGFPARHELKVNINSDAKDTDLYDDVTLSLVNRWSTRNMWGKDKLYIEGAVSGGVIGYSLFSINTLDAISPMPVMPYGMLNLKLFSGTRFSPEIKIKDSRFIFTSSDLNTGEKPQNYNYYYIKLPLGFHVPFFGYKSQMNIDGSFSSLHGNFNVLRPVLIKGQSLQAGDKFYTVSTNWNVRLYLDTPVVLKPSISEYAYFGIYYDESISPKSATPGTDYAGYGSMIVEALTRSGGIFYEMRQDLYKGFMFGIAVHLGVGDIEVKKNSQSYDVKYDGTKGLISYKVNLSIGYQYIFKKQHVGLAFDAGVEYAGNTPFFFAKQENLFGLRADGELRYYAELKFLFGY